MRSPTPPALHRGANIAGVVREFVLSLEDCGIFGKTSDTYLVPAQYAPQVTQAIIDAICSVPDNCTGRRSHDGGYGIQRVPEPKRTVAAVGHGVLSVPNTVDADAWRGMDIERDLPQLHLDDPGENDVPCVEEGRYFPMDDAAQGRFQELITDANKGLLAYVRAHPPLTHHSHSLAHTRPPPSFARKAYHLPKEQAQMWVCKWAVVVMHKYCPNFTSLVGAQYLQRIAALRAADDLSDPRPRAYFPVDTYRNEINADEMLVVGQFVYAIGSTLFSRITHITV